MGLAHLGSQARTMVTRASPISGEADGDPLEWRVGPHREKLEYRMKYTLNS